MTINNPQEFVDSVWDWGFLDDAFAPTKIKVTDGDGIVERRGHFLLFETKKKGVEIPDGQQYLFDAWVAAGNHAMIIWGRQSEKRFNIKWLYQRGELMLMDKTLDDIKSIVRKWFQWANSH